MRRATFEIYEARLRVESDDGPALRILTRLLAGFPAVGEGNGGEAPADPGSEGVPPASTCGRPGDRPTPLSPSGPGRGSPARAPREAVLSLRFVPRPAPPPDTASPLFRHGGVQLLREGRCLWLADEWSRLRVHVAAGRAEGDVHPGSWTHERAFEEQFLRLGVHALLRGQGLFHLNATAVLAGDAVALVVGVPGETVPSLAGAWAGGGGAALDESALLWSDGHGVLAGAWPELSPPATGSAASSSLFVDQSRLATATPGEPDLERLVPRGPGEYRPDVLLFLLPSAGRTRLEPLLTREALASLVAASPLLFTQPELAAAHLDTLRALARQCRCYRLYLGLGPRPRPQSLSRLLPAIARSPEVVAPQP